MADEETGKDVDVKKTAGTLIVVAHLTEKIRHIDESWPFAILREALDARCHFQPWFTTRPPRLGDITGRYFWEASGECRPIRRSEVLTRFTHRGRQKFWIPKADLAHALATHREVIVEVHTRHSLRAIQHAYPGAIIISVMRKADYGRYPQKTELGTVLFEEELLQSPKMVVARVGQHLSCNAPM